MWIRRLTLWLYIFPCWFVDDIDVDDWSLVDWSEGVYQWKDDPWNGYKDVVQPAAVTKRTGTGDCDDYAALVISYLIQTTDDELSLVFMFSPLEARGHVIVYDETAQITFSSGNITGESLESYKERSSYRWFFERSVNCNKDT